MNLQRFDQMNMMRECGKKILDAMEEIEKKRANPQYDKVGAGFSISPNFASVEFSLSIDAWAGHGNRECDKIEFVEFGRANGVRFKEKFLVVLNRHFAELMRETAEEFLNMANEERQKIVGELKAALEELGEQT